MLVIIICLLLSIVCFFIDYILNKRNRPLDKKISTGIITSYSDIQRNGIRYDIDIADDNIKAKSISYYFKMYKKLKKGDRVNVEYFITKNGDPIATILDDELIPCIQEKTSWFFGLAIFFFVISIVAFLQYLGVSYGFSLSKILVPILFIIMIVFLFLVIIYSIIIRKNGKELRARVIKIEYDYGLMEAKSDYGKQGFFIITVKVENIELKRSFMIDSYTESIRVGDMVDIIAYKNKFLFKDYK